MSVNKKMMKIAIAIAMLAVSAAMICYVLVDVARRQAKGVDEGWGN